MPEETEEIRFALTDEDIDWKLDWDVKKFPDKSAEEAVFESEKALALMLINDVVFTNSRWWEKELSDKLRNSICCVFVNCNDVFAWGCADAEDLPHDEIEKLYRMWRKDHVWGAAVWCIQQRKEMPQPPVEKRIREQGVWDLDSMGLEKNHYATACAARAK